MINFVLCSPSSCVSGRLLARKITEIQGRRCFYYGRNRPRARRSVNYVRYGSHAEGIASTPRRTVAELNSREAVDLASNKLASLRVMRDAGVPVPPEAPLTVPYDKRRIFRKARHFAGSDNPQVVQPGEPCPTGYDYALDFIKSKCEYRVHILKGRAIRVQRKRRLDGHDDADYQIRSENRGWGLKLVSQYHADLVPTAVKAVEALGLDFGAVDVLKTRDDKFYVLEVNTAPGLNENGAELYARALIDSFVNH